ncbi:hypothetical protein LCGC14_2674970 [marine sediment metagenome]|uniref:Helix-turn-helix domain-containing protein n=1 Tax=marine sediment metagenome TaxID=412755 RepID=A0A0F8ZMZ8_9ZZZZ|nr:AlpA family phage regulatory protein [Methylophaga sp.]
MTNSRYLSVDSVAKRFEVSKATIWRWTQCQQLPKPVKLNGSTRWKLSDIEGWENERAYIG